MPLTFSVTRVITLGLLTCATLTLLTGQRDKLSLSECVMCVMCVMCVIFIAKFAYL